MGRSLGLGVAQVVAAALLPVAIVLLVFHAGRVGATIVAVLRRLRLIPPPRPVPERRAPVEAIAADLRRLAALRRSMPRGSSRARQQGVLRAYDEVLATACRTFEVSHGLDSLPPGFDRDVERLRVEDALRSAGLALDPPAPRHQDLP